MKHPLGFRKVKVLLKMLVCSNLETEFAMTEVSESEINVLRNRDIQRGREIWGHCQLVQGRG